MVNLKEANELQSWMHNQSRDVAITVASRAALRAVPCLSAAEVQDESEFQSSGRFTLPVFRAVSLAWVGAMHPQRISAAASDAMDQLGTVLGRFTDNYRVASDGVVKVSKAKPLDPTSVFEALHSASVLIGAAGSAFHAASALAGYKYADAIPLADSATLCIVAAANSGVGMWETAYQDMGEIVSGADPIALTTQPLWTDLSPQWTDEGWMALRAQLLSLDEDWDVWTDWYEARLRGDPINAELELARVLEITDEDWRQGPAHVNAKLKEIEARFTNETGFVAQAVVVEFPEALPEIPPQQPAPIEADVVDDRIVRLVREPSRQTGDLAAIHKTLRGETQALAERCSGQFRDAEAILMACHRALGERISETIVHEVGYWAGVLSALAVRLDDQLLEDAAGRLAGLVLNLERFLKQFDEWNAYEARATLSELSDPAKRSKAFDAARDVVAGIGDLSESFDTSVAAPLEQLQAAVADATVYNPETLYGFYRSLANVLQVAAGLALEKFPETSEAVRAAISLKGVDKFAAETFKEVRSSSVKAAAMMLVAYFALSADKLIALSSVAPSLFGWVPTVLRYFGLA